MAITGSGSSWKQALACRRALDLQTAAGRSSAQALKSRAKARQRSRKAPRLSSAVPKRGPASHGKVDYAVEFVTRGAGGCFDGHSEGDRHDIAGPVGRAFILGKITFCASVLKA